MNTGVDGEQKGLTLTYEDKVICTDFTLTVTAAGFDYPKYPEEGSVQVDKTGTALGTFKETGLANIQLSATGIPQEKGVDLIIMLDMSGSMSSNQDITTADGTKITRIDALKIALKQMISTLMSKNADVRVAMADFGDLDHFEFPDAVRDASKRELWGDPAYNHLNYLFTNGDMEAHAFGRWWGTKKIVGTHEPTIYTGNHSVDAGAFEKLDAHDIAYWKNMVDGLHQGEDYLWETNYDRGMEYIYQLGYAIRQSNIKNGEDRELVVIFMSDGGAWQYNYFSGTSSQGKESTFTSAWSDWLTGDITNLQYNPASGGVNHTVNSGYTHGTQSPYGYFYNPKGQNWLAEAIKGDPNSLYPVVNKYAFRDDGTSPCIVDDVAYDYYYGDVRRYYTGYLDDYYQPGSTARSNYDAHNYDHAYMAAFRGLGAKMYTLGFAFINDGSMSVDVMDQVMTSIASGSNYYFKANSQEQLNACFNSISSSLTPAATDAYFTDTMGAEYDLWMGDAFTTHNGYRPTIKVRDYTLDAKHQRTGTPSELEVVTFGSKGEVYSDQVFDETGKNHPNILGDDGVIRAKYFYYNTSKTNPVNVDVFGKTVRLAPETFLWSLGTVGTTERVLEYQVYLTGSMEGKRENGVYETNESAVLNYVNYQGNECHKDTTPPAFPWQDNLAGYRFYLVDATGTPISDEVNQEQTTFLDSKKLTELKYKEFLQNSEGVTFTAKELLEASGLAGQYALYDPDATYTVKMGNDGNSWTITVGSGKNATTYVTNYGGSPTTNTSSTNESGVEYDRTVAWFAVYPVFEAREDTVVIDFGLPVDIDVLYNDSFGGSSGTLTGVQFANNGSGNSDTLPAGYADSAKGAFGTMTLNANKLRYTLNDMLMNTHEVFTYIFQNKGNSRYYYSTVTVIPATTIYYEDSFVTFKTFDYTGEIGKNEIESTWEPVGTTQDKVQAEDRPGQGLSGIDANNLYGYDAAYGDMQTYSLGSARKVNVWLKTDEKKKVTAGEYATAEFTFCGTGFDVISLTSNRTGTITVEVLNENGEDAGFYLVDTYYGYKYDEATKEWVVDPNATNALYQVPVIKVENLPYGKYTARITASYAALFDHSQYPEGSDGKRSYDFYLDAIRIYDPANDGQGNQTIEDAYKADNEGWPKYFELRNLIIAKGSFATDKSVPGIVFIDNTGANKTPTIEDYKNFGPNNELYLAAGQAIAFDLNATGDVASVQIAMKTAGSGSASVSVYAAGETAQAAQTISTATDMYYDITALNGKTVTIANTSDKDSILSITNVKVTYKTKPVEAQPAEYFSISPVSAQAAVQSLRSLYHVVFAPERLDVKLAKEYVRLGEKVYATITTEDDVDHLVVNGVKVTAFTADRRTGTRTWKVKFTAKELGQIPLTVVAYDADALASDPVTVTVTVFKLTLGTSGQSSGTPGEIRELPLG